MEKKKKYEVTIKEACGTCESSLFKKMAQKGDITSVKVQDMLGKVVNITGYAVCHIVTDEKEFDMGYYATNEGIISTGSEVFRDSVEDYMGDVDLFKIVSLKTKKGTTYKVSPILTDNEDMLD